MLIDSSGTFYLPPEHLPVDTTNISVTLPSSPTDQQTRLRSFVDPLSHIRRIMAFSRPDQSWPLSPCLVCSAWTALYVRSFESRYEDEDFIMRGLGGPVKFTLRSRVNTATANQDGAFRVEDSEGRATCHRRFISAVIPSEGRRHHLHQ